MSEKFTGVERSLRPMLFDPKKINLPYTLFIIKPETCLDWNLSQEILTFLEEKGFMKGLILSINGFDVHKRILRVYPSPHIFISVVYLSLSRECILSIYLDEYYIYFLD